MQRRPDTDNVDERLVDARSAAYLMNMPKYWLKKATQRRRMGIPFYDLEGFIRFRLSELAQWQREHSVVAPFDVRSEGRGSRHA